MTEKWMELGNVYSISGPLTKECAYVPSRKGTTLSSASRKRSLTLSSPFQLSLWVLRSTNTMGCVLPYLGRGWGKGGEDTSSSTQLLALLIPLLPPTRPPLNRQCPPPPHIPPLPSFTLPPSSADAQGQCTAPSLLPPSPLTSGCGGPVHRASYPAGRGTAQHWHCPGTPS